MHSAHLGPLQDGVETAMHGWSSQSDIRARHSISRDTSQMISDLKHKSLHSPH
jgi:hypothetical protein